ncbi:hypothetical protein DW352_22110 [Pseudolabrys taiwanensis]|uniref:Uncharacterized protein n=1 Tax=Pseudolabrys taiwanensis TaxID=331696 RepID=A0A346A1D1_9HYPH|nr:hypothetical protein [Pseudolabrys taiwanensis]AXK82978.1 hypothetical protein DW352_22110 [Pseudolabrys taiwanensis]
MSQNTQDAQQSDIEALLPWHAAGTLNRRDAQRVEDALQRDPELARRYELVREELGETIHLNETLGAPSARAMEALFSKIDAEPARKSAAAGGGFGLRMTEFFASFSPRTLAYAGAVAVLAIVLQAGLIGGLLFKETSGGGYQTASAPSTDPGVGAFTLVRFAPQATSDDINRFLSENKLSIVAGPMPGGLYKVRVGMAAMPKADLAEVVKKLQQDKTIGFIAVTQ